MHSKELIIGSRLIGRTVSNLVYDINNIYRNYNIYLNKNQTTVNAHSILGVLSLGVEKHDRINILSDCQLDKFEEIYNFIKSKTE